MEHDRYSVGRFVDESQFELYSEQGYLIIEGFFSEPELIRIYASLRSVASEDFKVMLNLDRAEDLLEQSPDSDPADRAVVSKMIREIQLNERMVGILEELYGREMVAVQSLIIYKEKGTPYSNQAWNPHQDNSYTQNANGMYLAVGYPLLDCNSENGGLYFYPGSHKEDILPSEDVEGAKQKAGENPGNKCIIPDKYKKVDINLKRGDALIFHGNLIHGSYPNSSYRSRPFLVNNYLPYGEEFISGRTSKRRVIRCH
jgi:phytanoyl-CoA hydroxylase